MEVWYIIIVFMIGGHQVEFSGIEHFKSLSACNEQAVKIVELPIIAPFAMTCASKKLPESREL